MHLRKTNFFHGWSKKLSVLLLALLPATAAFAQSASISGIVRDASTSTNLQGARVSLQGTSRETLSNREGAYSISGLAAGDYTIVVSFLGFETERRSVSLTEGQRLQVSFDLRSSFAVLEDFEVRGIQDAQARALNIQRSSDNIVSVLSSDAVGRFPDRDLAESLNRVSGISVARFRGEGEQVVIRGAPPGFSTVTVDGQPLPLTGNDRGAGLNIFSPEIVSSIEVSKAITPDVEASSIGGRVNIVTRGALDRDGRLFRIKAAGTFAELGAFWNPNFSLSYSDVFGENRNMGLVNTISYERTQRNLNNLENSWSNQATGFFPTQFNTKAYDIVRTKINYSGRFDYIMNEQKRFYANLTLASGTNDEDRHTVRFVMPRNNVREGSDRVIGIVDNVDMRYDYNNRYTETFSLGLNVGGKFEGERVIIDYNLNYSSATSKTPEDKIFQFEHRIDNRNPSARYSVRYDYSNPDFPVFTRLVPGTTNPLNSGSMLVDPTQALFFEWNKNGFGETTTDTIAGNIDFTIPMEQWNNPVTFKTGLRFSDTGRDNDRERPRARGQGPTLQEILGDLPMNNFGRYEFSQRADRTASRAAQSQVTGINLTLADTLSNDWEIGETIIAAYGMGTVDFGRLRVLGGVRVEYTDLFGEGFVTRDGARSFQLQRNERDYTNVFPSLHFRFAQTENLIFRAAYTTGISRPSFSELRPAGSINEEAAVPTISSTNPNIDPTTAHNFDLMAEYYIRPLGVISGGFFYKSLSDVVFSGQRIGQPGDTFLGQNIEGFRITRAENGPSGYIQGFEVSWDQGFYFLPDPFNNFGIFANFTYVDSEVTLPDFFGGGKEPLGNQSEYVGNFSFYYETAKVSARISFNYQSDYIASFADDPINHLFIDGRTVVDFTSRYTINQNWSVFLEINNMTNSLQRRFRGDRTRVDELEGFGRFFTLGVNAQF
jgi:TonB-dependent receptor